MFVAQQLPQKKKTSVFSRLRKNARFRKKISSQLKVSLIRMKEHFEKYSMLNILPCFRLKLFLNGTVFFRQTFGEVFGPLKPKSRDVLSRDVAQINLSLSAVQISRNSIYLFWNYKPKLNNVHLSVATRPSRNEATREAGVSHSK